MKEKTNERIIKIFKYFVQFLEIYGAENYGQSAEVNWERVWNFCNSCNVLDFNFELEDLVYNNSEEQFRDNVFTFIEKQALEGYPLWRLFTMSKWLEDKCEEELHESEYKKDVEYFNKTKCYRCKNFHNEISMIGSTLIDPIVSKSFNNMEELKNYVKEHKCQVQHYQQMIDCNKRKELLEESQSSTFRTVKFKYKKFNADEFARNKWSLNPMEHKRCPYFEENKEMTVDKFIELYEEINRYY